MVIYCLTEHIICYCTYKSCNQGFSKRNEFYRLVCCSRFKSESFILKMLTGSRELSHGNLTAAVLARALAALKDAAGWMEEEEEEVKDWKAENRMNGSGNLEGCGLRHPAVQLCLPTMVSAV